MEQFVYVTYKFVLILCAFFVLLFFCLAVLSLFQSEYRSCVVSILLGLYTAGTYVFVNKEFVKIKKELGKQ